MSRCKWGAGYDTGLYIKSQLASQGIVSEMLLLSMPLMSGQHFLLSSPAVAKEGLSPQPGLGLALMAGAQQGQRSMGQ